MDRVCVFFFFLICSTHFLHGYTQQWLQHHEGCSTFLCTGVVPCVTGLPPWNSTLLMSPPYVLPCYSLHSSPPSSPQFVSFHPCFCSFLQDKLQALYNLFSSAERLSCTVRTVQTPTKNAPSALLPLYDTSWSDVITGKVYDACFCYVLAQVQLVTLNVPWSEVKMWWKAGLGLRFKSHVCTSCVFFTPYRGQHVALIPSLQRQNVVLYFDFQELTAVVNLIPPHCAQNCARFSFCH